MYDERVAERMMRERMERAAGETERQGCAAFLELLADVDAYASANLPAPELLRRVAAHLREREKWESVIRARRDAKKQLPWE